MRLFAPRFRFLDPGPLRGEGIELVQPARAYAPEFLSSIHHPDCVREPECQINQRTLMAYLDAVPNGCSPPSPRRGRAASYQFWIRCLLEPGLPDPPQPIGGTISLRIGGRDTERYYGHIGYLVFPPSRGSHLASRAAQLLLPLARWHGLGELWITTNPDNVPSRRTCERLGAVLVDEVPVPRGHPLWKRGERRKLRYVLKL